MLRFCFALFLCLVVGTVIVDAVRDLKCHCTVCEESQNNTCITDGLCYTEAHWRNGEVQYTYGCMNRQQYIPPEDIPYVCRDGRYGVECCFRDNCNRDLQPSIIGPTNNVPSLKCHCTVCEESQNNTCVTDGLCYTEVIRKIGGDEYAYGCMNRNRFLPPEEIPFLCRDPKIGVECCFQDYCNRDQQPSDNETA